MKQVSRQDVWELSDSALVRAGHVLASKADELQLPMSQWTKRFVLNVAEQFLYQPLISWKQRRLLRQIVEEMSGILYHRAVFSLDMKEVLLELTN